MAHYYVLPLAILACFVGVACVAPSIGDDDASTPVADTLRLEPIPASRQFPDCGSEAPALLPCRIPNAPERSEVEQRLNHRAAAAWGGDDRWTIAYRAPDDSVTALEVVGGVQLPLSRFEGTRLWALALRLPGADSAVISINFFIHRGKELQWDTTTVRQWRGPKAPPKPRDDVPLAGTLRVDSLWSEALRSWRGVTVYLPPGHGRERRIPVVYFADGQTLRLHARAVDPLVASGQLPPVALVGVWVSTGSPDGGPARGMADDLRSIEYHEGIEAVPGADSAFVVARYRGHKILFTEEVRRWAEDALFVSTERRWRAVHGSSSGGSYALTLGRERPDLYGFVIANSSGSALALAPPVGGWENAASHYLSAGRLEDPSLARTLTALGDSLAQHGVPRVVNLYPSGHDAQVWAESLPQALAWWLVPSAVEH